MKALMKMNAGEELALRDAPVPEPQAGEVRVKVCYAGICGTDIHIRHDEFPTICPRIIGHEYSGVIDAVGEGVDRFSAGDRVVSNTAAHTCGHCSYCTTGQYMLCDEKRALGTGINGAFADYFTIKADCVYRIPDGVSAEDAALCEPAACTVRMVIEHADIQPGNYVYIAGPGAIGQIAAQLARLCGAHVTVGGTDADADRLKLALELGADAVINVSQENILEKARSITNGEMYDAVFECSGAAPSIAACNSVIRKGGTYGQIGLFGKPVSVAFDSFVLKECRILTSYSSEPSSWRILLRLMGQNKLSLKPLISRVFSLDKWEEAFAAAENKEGYKILFKL